MKPKNSRICIVGAGAAGLSAGYYLKERGYENITVLERGSRVGGKCRTIEFQDYSFDTGAVYVTAAFSEVRRLAKRFGEALYTESPAVIASISPSNGIAFKAPLSAMIDKQSLSSFALAVLGYSWIRFRLRGVIDRPGFAHISGHSELCVSFCDWLKFNKLSALEPMFEIPITLMGYGYLHEIPAPYALKYLTLDTFWTLVALGLRLPTPWPKRFVRGYQHIWDDIAAQLDVRLGAEIEAVDRRGTIRVELKNAHSEEFDCLVLACPLDVNSLSQFLTLSREDEDLFKRITVNEYVVTSYAIPNLGLPKRVVGMLPVPEMGLPWAMVKPFADSELVQFYTRLDEKEHVSDARVIEGIGQYVAALGASLPKDYVAFDRWNYFPHVTAQDFRDGFYDRLEALQGQSNTYYCGGIAAFESVETVIQYSRQLVECYF